MSRTNIAITPEQLRALEARITASMKQDGLDRASRRRVIMRARKDSDVAVSRPVKVNAPAPSPRPRGIVMPAAVRAAVQDPRRPTGPRDVVKVNGTTVDFRYTDGSVERVTRRKDGTLRRKVSGRCAFV
ncbi:hypothetical protein [uncultured Rhodospira sp.]|uniref:hypothetical protein n=1 Tax=uncultured Rhodospira sp. TaxID=1936189 RepID=UPI002606A418|nr:hypothetical protein [uncultured Rhodospira sp.]